MTPRFDISGAIGEGDATSAALGRFLDANPGAVEVVFNSFGGIASEGAGLFAELERHGGATAIVQGIAASAASLAMLGARRVRVHDAALVMLHEPAALTMGTADDMQATADSLDKIGAVYAGIYARATGNPVARIAAWMAEETWLDATECVALGFADEVLSGSTEPAVPVAAFDYRKFRSAPAALVQMALANGWATELPISKTEFSK